MTNVAIDFPRTSGVVSTAHHNSHTKTSSPTVVRQKKRCFEEIRVPTFPAKSPPKKQRTAGPAESNNLASNTSLAINEGETNRSTSGPWKSKTDLDSSQIGMNTFFLDAWLK